MLDNEEEKEAAGFDMAHYLDIFLKRRWLGLIVWFSVIILTAIITFTMRPVYRASALLLIEKERGGSAFQTGPTVDVGNDDYYQTQYKLLKSEALLKIVYSRLNLGDVSEFSGVNGYPKLVKNIAIVPVTRSRLVNVYADSYTPQLAAEIVNTVANLFIEQNLSNQLFISKDVLNVLQGKKSEGATREIYESLPAVVNNSLLQELKQGLAQLQSRLAEASARYTPRHPQILSIQAIIKMRKEQIQDATDKIVQSLKIDLSGQLKGNNIRLVDAAIPPLEPIKPRKGINMLLAVVGGLVLGIFVTLLVNFIDQTVHTQQDLEEKTGLPFLGIVPFTPHTSDKTIYNHLLLKERSILSESIRNLRTLVNFTLVGQKKKSFLITSTMMGEGKTFVASNLAVAIAQTEEKVLIIDGDLRRPTLHNIFRVSNTTGLSDFLAGGNDMESLKCLIHKTDIPNLSVLPCGTRSANPAELLNTPRLSALLAWAGDEYDYVVVDCTPMHPITDVLLWGRYISRCIYIVNFGKTRVALIKHATKHLTAIGVKILGAVVSMSKLGGLSYYNYDYYYGPDDTPSDLPPEKDK